jgi:hypothetical protein
MVMLLASPSRDRRSSEMERDQQYKTNLDRMAVIKSRFQWFCFLPIHVAIGEAPNWSSDQWSRKILELMATIKSRFQWLCYLPLQVASRETLKWSRINPDQHLI